MSKNEDTVVTVQSGYNYGACSIPSQVSVFQVNNNKFSSHVRNMVINEDGSATKRNPMFEITDAGKPYSVPIGKNQKVVSLSSKAFGKSVSIQLDVGTAGKKETESTKFNIGIDAKVQ